MILRRFYGAAAILLAANLVGTSAAARSSAQEAQSVDYRIGPADVLHISVWKNEALSRTIPVRPDGMISLPLVDEVRAAGLTPMQLRDILAKKLAEYVTRPEVSVIVQEVHSFAVSVLGEVENPGRYELKSRATVFDVLALAGGLTAFASRSRILILRRQSETMRRIRFNYDKAMKGGQENLFVQPGDIIVAQ